MPELYLLDGMALAYRGHFALMRNPRMTSRGMNTSMVLVFANTLLDLLNNKSPSHMAVVFDTPEPTHRHKIYPAYKAQRDEIPEDIVTGLPYLDKLCAAFNIKVIRVPGWEADDVIGTLAKRADGEFMTYMVTPDKDYGQLVSESAAICKPGRTGSGLVLEGPKEILEKWGIESVDQVIDILGLMGDSSDNVPGVPGIGEKTAQKLISRYTSVENLLDSVEDLKGKQEENLINYQEQAMLSKQLVTINCDVPLKVSWDEFQVVNPDQEKVADLFRELEFETLGKRVLGDSFTLDPPDAGEQVREGELKPLEDVAHEYRLTDTEEAVARLVDHLSSQELFCFDTETTGLNPRKCRLVGLAFSDMPHSGYYIPVPEDKEKANQILESLRPVFENPKIAKLGHNLKFDLSVLKWHGLQVRGRLVDTMLAAHLAVPDMKRNINDLSRVLLGYRPIPITDLIGVKGPEQLTMRDVPVGKLIEYAVEDADITYQLWEILEPKIAEFNQEMVFETIECPLVPVLVDMEYAGVTLDPVILKNMSENLRQEIETTRQTIYELAGEKFNLNSAKQMGDIFFDKLKLDPNARRTQKSKQYQTNEQVLSRLAKKHEIAEKVLHYRECTKLKSTYVDMLPGSVSQKTGRIHTHYEQAVTATGRMQSSGPNLQNIPVRSENGREIRRAFVASENHRLLSVDYSQIELRIAAHMSGDEAMIKAFKEGRDIHSTTAERVYGVEKASPEMRRKAKEVNFGIIYGISPFGLSSRLDIARSEASDLIDQYFGQYPGIREYTGRTIRFAQENGYVETITGRRRYLRDINSRNATVRGGAERNAINAPIQGTAADMIKIAMNEIHRRLEQGGYQTKMLLQVHDELVFDIRQGEEGDVVPLIEDAMVSAIPLTVPVLVEIGIGDTWLDAH